MAYDIRPKDPKKDMNNEGVIFISNYYYEDEWDN